MKEWEMLDAEADAGKKSFGIGLSIRYDYLPIGSYAELLKSIHEVYEAISRIYYPLQYSHTSDEMAFYHFRTREIYWPFASFLFPPLCIVESHTGDSIKDWITFDPKYREKFEATGDNKVYLPRWSAAIEATSAVLVGLTLGGHEIASYHLGILKDNLTLIIDSLQNEKVKQEVEELNLKLEDALNGGSPLGSRIKSSVENFKYHANQDYIRELKINEIVIRSRE